MTKYPSEDQLTVLPADASSTLDPSEAEHLQPTETVAVDKPHIGSLRKSRSLLRALTSAPKSHSRSNSPNDRFSEGHLRRNSSASSSFPDTHASEEQKHAHELDTSIIDPASEELFLIDHGSFDVPTEDSYDLESAHEYEFRYATVMSVKRRHVFIVFLMQLSTYNNTCHSEYASSSNFYLP